MDLSSARRLLLCLRYGIGDLVMETPALAALRQAAATARITALGAWPATDLLEGDGRIDAVVRVQDFGFRHWGDYGSGSSRDCFRSWLAKQDFEAVLDPSHAVLGIGQLIWEKGGAAIFDSGRPVEKEALREGRSGVAAIKWAARRAWGIRVEERLLPALQLSAADQEFARRFLSSCINAGPVIGCCPLASSPLKSWTVLNYVKTAGCLLEKTGGSLVLFAGPERELAGVFSRALGGRFPLLIAGSIHLKKVAALLASCRLFLGNDTGLMHLAAAMGVPGVALFGPTSPAIYLPPGKLVAIGGDEPCPHRLHDTFGPPACVVSGQCLRPAGRCIDRVSSGQVVGALTGLLEGHQEKRSLEP